MSAISGIGVSADLSTRFSRAVDDRQTRFIKVSIQNESLVHDLSVPTRGSLQEDLAQLQDSEEIIQDDTPAYLLTKLDDPPAEWLVIYYVPETAKVRDKVLLSRPALRSESLKPSLDAADLTPEAYAAHRRHVTAPKPLSASEQEMADVRAAERQAGGLSVYQGSRARTSHIGKTIGMPWAADLEDAVKDLAEGDDVLVIATIDMASEALVLHSTSQTTAGDVGASLPPDGACYAFFAWKHAPSRRDIVFIYSCPSSCPVKHRMVYASGFNAVFIAAQTLLADSPAPLQTRKIETSTPAEIDEAYLRSELDLSSGQGTPAGTEDAAQPRVPVVPVVVGTDAPVGTPVLATTLDTKLNGAKGRQSRCVNAPQRRVCVCSNFGTLSLGRGESSVGVGTKWGGHEAVGAESVVELTVERRDILQPTVWDDTRATRREMMLPAPTQPAPTAPSPPLYPYATPYPHTPPYIAGRAPFPYIIPRARRCPHHIECAPLIAAKLVL
ncbi:hypothetical protein B0H13DRAFT_2324260 [Mycena leptocephala]|nr:hypothetical protein B0H13DRAFT_2324260 [Mycena leptocephala]